MSDLTSGPPAIVFDGRRWPAEDLAALAAGWLPRLSESIPRTATVTALPLANRPDAVALLFALSCLPLPVAVLAPDVRAWRSDPPQPDDTTSAMPSGRGPRPASVQRDDGEPRRGRGVPLYARQRRAVVRAPARCTETSSGGDLAAIVGR